MPRIAIALALVSFVISSSGCSDDGIHNAQVCSTSWPGPPGSQCEAACAEPPTSTGGSCSASFEGGSYSCPDTFTFSGHTGCCVDRRAALEDTVYFAECN